MSYDMLNSIKTFVFYTQCPDLVVFFATCSHIMYNMLLTPDDSLPDKLANFFHNKITTIREKLDHTATSQIDPYSHDIKFCHLPFASIFRFSKADLKDMCSKIM